MGVVENRWVWDVAGGTSARARRREELYGTRAIEIGTVEAQDAGGAASEEGETTARATTTTTRNDDEWERAERKHERAHACDEERNGERSRGERDERGGTFV